MKIRRVIKMMIMAMTIVMMSWGYSVTAKETEGKCLQLVVHSNHCLGVTVQFFNGLTGSN